MLFPRIPANGGSISSLSVLFTLVFYVFSGYKFLNHSLANTSWAFVDGRRVLVQTPGLRSFSATDCSSFFLFIAISYTLPISKLSFLVFLIYYLSFS